MERTRLFAMAAGLITILCAGPAAKAQDASPEHLAAARAAAIASGAMQPLDNILPTLALQTQNLFTRSDPSLTLEIEQAVQDVALQLVTRRPELDQRIYAIWAENFTVEELREIATFFESPVGQKFAANLEGISAASVQIAREWSDALGRQMVELVRAQLIRQAGSAPGGSPPQ